MNKRIIIGLYFSFFATFTALLIFLYFFISPGEKPVTSTDITDTVKISLLVGCFAFPFGFIYSKNYLNNKYNLIKSLLVGVLISLLTLVSFFIYFAIFNAFSIPVSEAVLGSIALLFITSLIFMPMNKPQAGDNWI